MSELEDVVIKRVCGTVGSQAALMEDLSDPELRGELERQKNLSDTVQLMVAQAKQIMGPHKINVKVGPISPSMGDCLPEVIVDSLINMPEFEGTEGYMKYKEPSEFRHDIIEELHLNIRAISQLQDKKPSEVSKELKWLEEPRKWDGAYVDYLILAVADVIKKDISTPT